MKNTSTIVTAIAGVSLLGTIAFTTFAQPQTTPGRPTGADQAASGVNQRDQPSTDPKSDRDLTVMDRAAVADQAAIEKIFADIRQSSEMAPEKLFILENDMANKFVVELSKAVRDKVTDKEIKACAVAVIKDHEQANENLNSLATKMNLVLPKGLPAGARMAIDTIASLPEEKLGACYVMMLRAEHAKCITSYADHQVAIQDPSLKAFIAQTLPTLREHSKMVDKLAKDKNIGAKGSSIDGRSASGSGLNN